jgi:hypothetical protein
LSVGGAANFASTVTIAGAVSLASTLSVGGAAHFASTVTIVGNTTLTGNLAVGGTTTITGNSGFLGTVRVSGNTSLEGTLKVNKSAAAAVSTTAINGVTSVSLNFSTAQNWITSVTAAHTLARPTNAVAGQTGSIFLYQQGGSGTVSYNACWNFIGGEAPTFSTSNGAVDRLDYIVLSVSSDSTAENIQAVMTQEYS